MEQRNRREGKQQNLSSPKPSKAANNCKSVIEKIKLKIMSLENKVPHYHPLKLNNSMVPEDITPRFLKWKHVANHLNNTIQSS